MSRTIKTKQAFLDANMTLGSMNGSISPIAKLGVNGLNGLAPDFRTINAMTPYVKQNVLCFVLETPRFFEFLGNGQDMALILKALCETRAETIDGLDASIKANYSEMTAGRTEVFHTFTKTTRERSEPSFKWTDSYGRAISLFFETWIVMGLADPTTGIPGVVTLLGNKKLTARGNAYAAYVHTPEMVSATMIFIEPDVTGAYPIKAFLCTNMMPDNAGDYTASMDLTGSPDKQEITVKFTAMQEVGGGVNELASRILSTINRFGTNSNERRPYLGDFYSDTEAQDTMNVLEPALRNAKAKDLGSDYGEMTIGYKGQANDIATTEGIGGSDGASNGMNKANRESLNESGNELHSDAKLVRPSPGNPSASYFNN